MSKSIMQIGDGFSHDGRRLEIMEIISPMVLLLHDCESCKGNYVPTHRFTMEASATVRWEANGWVVQGGTIEQVVRR